MASESAGEEVFLAVCTSMYALRGLRQFNSACASEEKNEGYDVSLPDLLLLYDESPNISWAVADAYFMS